MDSAATAFSIGLLATTSPCVLPLYPGFLAYLSGQPGGGSPWVMRGLGVAVLGGVLTTMLALGALIAALSISIGRVLTVLVPVAVVAILLMGIAMLVGRNPFTRLPGIRIGGARRPLVDAFLYGLVYGPIALPCSGPLVVAIFAISATTGEALASLWVFLWFGLGLGAPLLVLSLVSGSLQRRLTRLATRHGRRLEQAGGLLLIGVAVYNGAQNWETIRLSLGWR